MHITDVRVAMRQDPKLKAFACITIDHCFVVRGLKIISGTTGIFVAMPSRRRPDGTYQDVAHPISTEARELLEQAGGRLEPAGPADLRGQVKQARDDLELVRNLEDCRMRAATPSVRGLMPAGAESPYAESRYKEIFAKARLGPGDDTAEAVAARVQTSAVGNESFAEVSSCS